MYPPEHSELPFTLQAIVREVVGHPERGLTWHVLPGHRQNCVFLLHFLPAVMEGKELLFIGPILLFGFFELDVRVQNNPTTQNFH